MTEVAGGGVGLLGAIVWPVYVGLGCRTDEVIPEENRAQIQWGADANGLITGHADPWTPRGEHHFVLYFHSPSGPVTASGPLDQPHRHDTSARVHVGPIFVTGDQITAQV